MFIKLFAHDMKCGTWKKKLGYLPIIAIVLWSGWEFSMLLQSVQVGLSVQTKGTILDYMLYFFRGMKEYDLRGGEPFVFPALWIVIFLLCSYFMLIYPFNDLTRFGQQVLLRTGGRKKWFVSKCIWIVVSTVVYFAIIYGTNLLVAWSNQGSFLFTISGDLMLDLSQVATSKMPPIVNKDVVIILFVLPCLCAITLNIMQLTLGLFIKPMYSFMCIAIFVLVSAYFSTDWLFPNCTMTFKSKILCGEQGINYMWSMITMLVFAALSIIIGIVKFTKFDVLSEE